MKYLITVLVKNKVQLQGIKKKVCDSAGNSERGIFKCFEQFTVSLEQGRLGIYWERRMDGGMEGWLGG